MKAPKEGEFKGYPTLTIYTGKTYKKNGEDEEEFITLGVRKAAAICDHIDHVRRFVEKHDKGSQKDG